MIFIVSTTFRAAYDWAREHAQEKHLAPNSGWKWVRDVSDVQGYRPPYEVVTISFGRGLTGGQLDALRLMEVREREQV